ncbi:hypothetical protein HGP28_11625 [Vibrio sp. SM6]|uniref:Uncharacterized protein n=1 Tax=Vibrio agarilyticus TaxID=2726741 RepID=A0A7X8YHI6_9VIBR|nr:hypothetical protein [Vibrio agarilyticus]NLS13541.1 hypothetical protein [Vibrio agarilyticus]
MKDCCELNNDEVLAIDGKTASSFYDDSRELGAINIVKAFATENGMSLVQQKVYRTSNEIIIITKSLYKVN